MPRLQYAQENFLQARESLHILPDRVEQYLTGEKKGRKVRSWWREKKQTEGSQVMTAVIQSKHCDATKDQKNKIW